MGARAESAAGTRRALLDAAGSLLSDGGADAVTLRAVGAAAGVTRGAPYGHFDDKEHLLTVLASERWRALAERLVELSDDPRLAPEARIRAAVRTLVRIGTEDPHLYALMFVRPSSHPELVLEAAAEAQGAFLEIVGAVVGAEAARSTGTLLLAGAHGIAGMQASGHLGDTKWGLSADELIELLVARAVAR